MLLSVILILFLIGITIGLVALRGKKHRKLSKENIPANLGILEHVPIQPLLQKLHTAWDEEYIRKVKLRFLQENPKRSEDEFEWLLFELKRYFLVTHLLKKAPMFSDEVDEIWHEMILFTKEYEAFSREFLGEMLHHMPNTNPEPAPQDRALFDWVYSQLFEITQFSWKTWGNFFRNPLSKEILKESKNSTKEELIEKYFRKDEEHKELAEYLVNRLKQQLTTVERIYAANQKGSFTRQRLYGDMTPLSLMMVFFSYYYFDQYWVHAKAYAFAEAARSTSGCTSAVFCGTAFSSNDGNGDHTGDSSDGGGGSSCSSCGGGCSS